MNLPRTPWRPLRRLTQLACLLGFLYLFRRTELTIHDPPTLVNVIFRLDPLLALAAMLAHKTVIVSMLLSLGVIALTLLFSRAFCGWLCPMGTLLDGLGKLVRIKGTYWRSPEHRLRPLRFGILALVLVAALFGLPIVGLFDPFAILVRSLTVAIDPVFSPFTANGLRWATEHAPAPLVGATETVEAFAQDHVLAFSTATYAGAWVSAAILLIIILLERFERRFWCRNLCPLGAMLGLFSRYSLLERKPPNVCKDCAQCATDCRMGAFDASNKFDPQVCTTCMDCVVDCPRQIATFTLVPGRSTRKRWWSLPRLDLSRRGFMTAFGVGVALPVVNHGVRALAGGSENQVIRPPGVSDSKAFLDLCVRCGECVKVCPTHGLHPVLLEAGGLAGMFAPRLKPRVGCCEYNCNLCASVCPTGAIPELDLEAKHQFVMGLAAFDTTLCLPWAKNESCIVCEEHCPVPDKAIRTHEVEITDVDGQTRKLLRPYVLAEGCIGCGICEWCCPLPGAAGVRVSPRSG